MLDDAEIQSMEGDVNKFQGMQQDNQANVEMGHASGHPQGS